MSRPFLKNLKCSRCGVVKPRENFYRKYKVGPDWRLNRCKPCAAAVLRQWRAAHRSTINTLYREKYTREQGQKAHLRRKYGITPEDYDRLLADQDGVCAVCHKLPQWRWGTRLNVDHDHVSGRIRGLLCWKCNIALGSLDEDVAQIRALADYIARWKEIS